MQVCYLINQLAPGGAPTLLLDVVRNTDSADAAFTVCYIEGDDSLVSDLETAGAEVVDFGARFKFDPRALWRIARFFRSRSFDVVHAHLPYAQTLARLAVQFGDVGCVLSTQHNVAENYHPVTRTLERVTRPLDDATIAVSEGVERSFRARSHRYDGTLDGQWCTIPNGIDVEAFTAELEAADPGQLQGPWAEDDLIYLDVARYVPAKSHEVLIDAMATVRTERPDAHLILVGWGERESALRAAVRDRGLDASVTITGRVPSVYEYYVLADVFVSSSTFEGLPITHLEAMAAGLPLVATAIPGVEEVVLDGETGHLVAPGDSDALAEAMIEFGDEQTRDAHGSRGYDRVREAFSIDATVEDHLELYRTCRTRD